MKILFTLFLMLTVNASFAGNEYFHSKTPVVIKGETYNVTINLKRGDTTKNDTGYLAIILNRICTSATDYTNYEKLGGYHTIKRVYFAEVSKDKITPNFVEDLSYDNGNVLDKYVFCNTTSIEYGLKVLLANSAGGDPIMIECWKVSSDLYAGIETTEIPYGYFDDEYINFASATEKKLASKQPSSFSLKPNFVPRFCGNIEAKEFPGNLALRNFLKNNADFVFKMNMDLYLDIVRYKAHNFGYDEETIESFLRTHDLRFLRYVDDEEILEKKITACVKLLNEAAGYINLGEVYYKDYTIELDKLNTTSRQVLWAQYDPKDDYYTTKRLFGETDYSYQQKALSLFLTNWSSLCSVVSDTIPTDAYINGLRKIGDKLTMRVYFLIQPSSAYDAEGNYKGVTAYGIKTILFKDCPTEVLFSADNKYINNIRNVEVRRCYNKAVMYLNSVIKNTELYDGLNTSWLYENNYFDLGDWHIPYDSCSQAYNYIAGQIIKTSSEERVMYFRLMTNYDCSLQPGYEIKFTNAATGSAVKIPVIESVVVQTGNDQGYYRIGVRTDVNTINHMINEKINLIELQCTGKAKYLIPHDRFYYNPNRVLKQQVKTLTASFSTDQNDRSEKLKRFLERGL